MTTRETIQRYFDALHQGGGWDACLADDVSFTILTRAIQHVHGKQAYLQATRDFYEMIVAVKVRELIVDGDKACAMTSYAMQPSNGAAFRSDVAEIFSVTNGKIDSFAIYFDPSPYPHR